MDVDGHWRKGATAAAAWQHGAQSSVESALGLPGLANRDQLALWLASSFSPEDSAGVMMKSLERGSVRRLVALVAVVHLLCAAAVQAQFKSVRIQVIDRGQADGILIRTPNSRWVVIDAGADNLQADAMAKVWGVDKLAFVITSHRHADHYGGMNQVLSRFPVDLYVANLDDCPNRTTDDTIRNTLKTRGIKAQGSGSDPIDVDGVQFVVLPSDPVNDPCPNDENDNSLVVRMDFGDFSMLFTGDAEQNEREFLMEHHAELLGVDVLKASHHVSFQRRKRRDKRKELDGCRGSR